MTSFLVVLCWSDLSLGLLCLLVKESYSTWYHKCFLFPNQYGEWCIPPAYFFFPFFHCRVIYFSSLLSRSMYRVTGPNAQVGHLHPRWVFLLWNAMWICLFRQSQSFHFISVAVFICRCNDSDALNVVLWLSGHSIWLLKKRVHATANWACAPQLASSKLYQK